MVLSEQGYEVAGVVMYPSNFDVPEFNSEQKNYLKRLVENPDPTSVAKENNHGLKNVNTFAYQVARNKNGR